MKKLTIALSFLLALGMAAEAGAALVAFSETFLGGDADGTLLTINNDRTYSFVFDLAGADNNANYYQRVPTGVKTPPTTGASGFLPSDMTVTSALLYYTFTDNDRAFDPVTIVTGVQDGSLSIADFTGSNMLDLNNRQNSRSLVYTFTPGDLAWLADGRLSVSIHSGDDIKLDQLRLVVQAQAPDAAQPVPLPSAAWLFGAGLIGVVGIKRKASA